MRALVITTVILSVLANASWAAGADRVVYVQSVRAKLLASPDPQAPVTATATRGEPLAVQENTLDWYRVSYQGKSGWVSGFLVAAEPPVQRVSLLDGAAPSLKDAARRRASTVTAARRTC